MSRGFVGGLVRDLVRPSWRAAVLSVALVAGIPGGDAVASGVAETLYAAGEAAVVLDYATLAKRIVAADVIYLGEQHGNPHHHAAQLKIVTDLVAAGRRPAIAFEFVTVPQTSELMSFVSMSRIPAHDKAAVRRLRGELGWQTGTEWRDYGPLLEFARAHRLRVAGIDLPQSLRRRISRVGTEGLNAVERTQFPDSGLVDPAYRQLMHERLNAAHCGFASPELVARLYATWLARNDTMTMAVTALAAEQPLEPVVVILGLGHVENNMGVYERVAQRAPTLRQLNIGFRARSAELRIADELAPLDRFGKQFAAAHEILWVTPPVAAQQPAPCEGLELRMKKMEK
ncbi:hypothetical protein ebA6113 [Aromatoleum aromaticum EbN1]|uniref:Haem-binding uptake Tiki superfamily ChaN domain-containing protein n=1 Tax=Aromatoleum aromaticum (strain DSM 19018 / LMG 30748 / EbN1) TaxID=76114 RepID=Q5NZ96_AROAE|nr:hypothetical protein ebA6113 [Aromatoleum aromaticum EbN1]